MTDYIARFIITLKQAISTSEDSLQELKINPTLGYINSIKITPFIDQSKLLSKLYIEAIYSSDDIYHLCNGWGDNLNPQDGIYVIQPVNGCLMYLVPPWDITEILIMPLLNYISALTLQAHVYWDMRENLQKYISDFTWILPDGTEAPPVPNQYPRLISVRSPELLGRPINASDWQLIQDKYNGNNQELPLWRVILAYAHREQENSIRNTVVQCATALDVGIQSQLPNTINFDMRVLNGYFKNKGIRTPDLRITDQALFNTLSQLWYTRHSIIHKGEAMIYDRNPQSGGQPIRPLQAQDTTEYLKAVPKGIEYVENNPP